MTLMLAAALLLQAAPPSDAEKLEAALKKFGDRNYVIMTAGEKIGTVSLTTRVEKEKGKAVVILEDRFTVKAEGMQMEMTMKEKSSLDGLRLLGAEGKVKEGDQARIMGLAIEDKKATLSAEGREVTFDLTEFTMGEHAMLRYVCTVPQKAEAEHKVDVLNEIAGTLQVGRKLKCLGKESVDIGGKPVEAFKWHDSWESKGVRKVDGKDVPATERVENFYWVHPEGYLLRSTALGRMEIVLDTK